MLDAVVAATQCQIVDSTVRTHRVCLERWKPHTASVQILIFIDFTVIKGYNSWKNRAGSEWKDSTTYTLRLSRSTLLISWSFSSSIELMSFLMSAVLKLLAFNDVSCLWFSLNVCSSCSYCYTPIEESRSHIYTTRWLDLNGRKWRQSTWRDSVE